MKQMNRRTASGWSRYTGLVSAIVLAAGVQVAAQEALYGFDPDTRIYVVQPGDTLWDISGKAYADPWKWPRIWENNPDVENPHLIRPEEKLVLPNVEGAAVPVAAMEPPVSEPEPAAEPEPISEPVAAPQSEPEPVAQPEPEPVAQPTPVPAAETEPAAGAEILQDASDVAQNSRLADLPQPKAAPRPTRAVVVRFGDEGVYREQAPDESIYLLGGEDGRTIFGKDDIVYVTGGRAAGLRPGQRFYVYDRGERIEDPDTDEDLGVFLRTTGMIQIEEVAEDSARARVVVSFDAIEEDMHLVAYQPMPKEIVPRALPKRVQGKILHAGDGQSMVAAWQIVYVDRGQRDGIEPGTMFRIERDFEPRRRKRKEPYHHLPPKQLGVGVAIDVGERTSTVLIVRSASEIEAGDRILTISDS
ncbi:MAG: LysM peptidoglycan-binding domain-containing protein [Candidatus Dadabacteria bacterium]|nr:MAG: LysM peptidoglycan-binding domain-containing protein [Candidatus Dadabacteria bacterium]